MRDRVDESAVLGREVLEGVQGDREVDALPNQISRFSTAVHRRNGQQPGPQRQRPKPQQRPEPTLSLVRLSLLPLHRPSNAHVYLAVETSDLARMLQMSHPREARSGRVE